MEKQLLNMYKEIFSKKENQPTWAVHKTGSPDELVHPTIPFVGKNYLEQPKKILVYASAENLADYYVDENGENNWEDNWLDNDKKAKNRHRGCFEEPSFQEGHLFFPHVHLEPMNNGCLATVVYYIASKLLGVKYENPKEFYETIAFGNYGKFSIETQLQETFRKKPSLTSKEKKSLKKDKTMKKFNKDYAGNGDLLSVSNEFIKADLKILQPDIIIMPKSIYKTNKKFIDGIKGDAIIIPIYQINSRNINIRIKKYPKTILSELESTIVEWYNKSEVKGKTKENFLSVFQYIDECMSEL